jgi:alginate O-acetyltransferase complex protein AlgI
LIFAYALISESAWSVLTPWLLISASLFFYAWWNWVFLPLFLFSVAFNYLWALLLDDHQAEEDARTVARRKKVLAIGIAVNLALLFYFKFATSS